MNGYVALIWIVTPTASVTVQISVNVNQVLLATESKHVMVRFCIEYLCIKFVLPGPDFHKDHIVRSELKVGI